MSASASRPTECFTTDSKMAGAKHVWMVRALNEEVQEMVSEALPLVEASDFQAADELQRLQKVMTAFKKAMRKIVESESSTMRR
jgi:hypothetical protein